MAAYFDDDELSMSLTGPPPQTSPSSHGPPEPPVALPTRKGSRKGPVAGTGKAVQRIGQYSIKKTLGEGSFGKVKLAVHRVSGQEVALKIISRKKLISRDMAGRVEREIQYLQLLRHPHIIKLFTVITTPNEIIMVLEYAGEELFDYIVKHGKMSENKARRFFQQIVCAVEYCHRHKIVHRDLKPENLLLDSELNVKIADFGLSNIMTDGNFLKTSCGSPNYAAPEVISGKLYAGPEVDVWSCGIILYVLLIGRLPFDDDFIPALFRKINSGTYHIPSYLSSGARNLIQRMLKVNPVQRISIQEIRQDDWFNENLEDYLKPPVEEFMDTGVDPNKAIDPRKLAPGKTAAVQDQIHQSVIGKLGKTMGYAKDDVAEALKKEEPNAIKDAYMIVRENQIMRDNPTLVTANNTQPFMAQSPPAWDTNHASAHFNSLQVTSPLTLPQDSPALKREPDPSATQPVLGSSVASIDKDYVSKASILASSLPFYHQQYMEQHRKHHEARRAQEESSRRIQPQGEELDGIGAFDLEATTLKSPEEQAATARHLKPQSLSTLQLQQIVSIPPAVPPPADDAKPESKKGRTRWQFGIRSRNVPHEAMHCVYKALKAQGAQWEVPAPPEPTDAHPPRTYPVHVQGATSITETIQTRSNSPELTRYPTKSASRDGPARNASSGVPSGSGASGTTSGGPSGNATESGGASPHDDGEETDDEDIDPAVAPAAYIPKDPWCIRVRWRKDGMLPAARLKAATSAHSSQQNLPELQMSSRPGSVIAGGAGSVAGLSSATNSTTSVPSAAPASSDAAADAGPSAAGSCFVYMEVQLYTIEAPGDKGRSGTYLVDFKCSGYEALVERVVGETGRHLVGCGVRVENKDVSSPQPFLDLTNKLVIHLAGGS